MANNTHSTESQSSDLETRIRAALELVRPAIKEDEGDIEFVDVSDTGLVRIRFLGACIGCPSSSQTLQQGIERVLKERIPEVTKVEATTDT